MSLFDDMKSYVGFSDADAEALERLHPLAKHSFESIADHFYECILEHEAAQAAITGGAQQVDRLKQTLIDWMDSGLRGPHDAAFYERRARIGRTHVRVELPQYLMLTAMNVMRLDFRRVVEDVVRDVGEAGRANDAVDKLFDLELAIMLQTYLEDSEAKLDREIRTRLMQKLTAVSTLSAGLAHEIRNPLNAAGLQLQLLARRTKKLGHSAEQFVEPIRIVEQELERLSHLVEDFLRFARPPELRVQEVDLAALTRRVVELEKVTAEQRAVALELKRPERPVVINGDPERLQQVFLNLIRNAIEAVPDGGYVHISVGREGARACIVVEDNGPGIDEEALPRLFDPFFSTKEGGTGLGLSITHSLVSAHGGEVRVTSKGGARFEILLPKNPPTEDIV